MVRLLPNGVNPPYSWSTGTFTFLNTLTLHLLRLAPPLSYFRRRLRYGLFSPPTFGPPEREGDEGERRWQAAVAGAVGSLGILWESKSRRAGVAQQSVAMFLLNQADECQDVRAGIARIVQPLHPSLWYPHPPWSCPALRRMLWADHVRLLAQSGNNPEGI